MIVVFQKYNNEKRRSLIYRDGNLILRAMKGARVQYSGKVRLLENEEEGCSGGE